jgi:hypothetical protein
MNPSINRVLLAVVAGISLLAPAAPAQTSDPIGIWLLRTTTTNLNGSGIRVAQPEGLVADNPPAWQVNPGAVGQPADLLTYSSGGIFTNAYPNSLGAESWHANQVGYVFYGMPDGLATNVTQVDGFDQDSFVNLVSTLTPLNDSVVNQSFTFGIQSIPDQQSTDLIYDNYAALYKTLFVSGVGNDGSVQSPATCYNGIGVGAYGTVYSSIGPTIDNGRCKPDLCAPDYVTSFATPQVAGSAAVLLQAALRGDGGRFTSLAVDPRTIKALLLNGATKPADWTNSNSSPLDAHYGAGVLNVFNSYQQLIGGKRGYNISSRVISGRSHLSPSTKKSIGVLNGWDFNTITTPQTAVARDGVNHYYFNATNSAGSNDCYATLVWNRHFGTKDINNLDLFLYNCANSNLVACSTSLVDNVEHIFVPQLAPGRYDLQVWKSGSPGGVSVKESYALAFTFTASNARNNPFGK